MMSRLFLLTLLISAPAAWAQDEDPRRSQLTSDESEAKADKRPIKLTAGEDRAVDLDFEANAGANGIAIGNPTVVATTLVKIGDKRQIVFKPLKAGTTTVTVRDVDGTLRLIFNVTVTGNNLLRLAAEVRSLLRDVEGLDIRVVGNNVVVDGELLTPADYGKLVTVLNDKDYIDHVINMAILSPLAMQVLAKRIQEDVNTFAPNVRTRVVNGVIFLEGTVDNGDQARRSAKVAATYLPPLRPGDLLLRAAPAAPEAQQPSVARALIQNFIVINPPPPKKQEKLVRVTINFVELAKDYSKLFGFKWEPGFTSEPQIAVGTTAAGAVGAASGSSFSATLSSLFPKLQTAQEAGYARILRTGTVVVRSGQPAQLVEQTQFPFIVTGANGATTTQNAPVGLEVGVTPRILGQSEDIEMELKMNQITFVGRGSAGGPPITSTHKVETRVYVKSNESAAVAAANSEDVGTEFNKDAPDDSLTATGEPIFSLKRSKNFKKKRSQFVIFVTPQIIENASDGTEDLKKNFRVRVK